MHPPYRTPFQRKDGFVMHRPFSLSGRWIQNRPRHTTAFRRLSYNRLQPLVGMLPVAAAVSRSDDFTLFYLDLSVGVCYTPNSTVLILPQRQLEPIQGEPSIGSFFLTTRTGSDILVVDSTSPPLYPASCGRAVLAMCCPFFLS